MNFDEIHAYWQSRAVGDDSVQSTTQDVYLREIELRALANQIQRCSPRRIADIGCGDGRTTLGLARDYSVGDFCGYDYSSAMVANANKLLKQTRSRNIEFKQHDIRNPIGQTYDFIYTTRCLINLPTWEHQSSAIDNIHDSLRSGGVYVMIENFVESHANFNQVRSLFGLPEIPIREHNLFFERAKLLQFVQDRFEIDFEENISSTYYLVSRVIYSKICAEEGKVPDYFDMHHRYAAGLPHCGDFGPVRLVCFRKK